MAEPDRTRSAATQAHAAERANLVLTTFVGASPAAVTHSLEQLPAMLRSPDGARVDVHGTDGFTTVRLIVPWSSADIDGGAARTRAAGRFFGALTSLLDRSLIPAA